MKWNWRKDMPGSKMKCKASVETVSWYVCVKYIDTCVCKYMYCPP